jgi:RimJ/RimL family protein N-acetyltransferase
MTEEKKTPPILIDVPMPIETPRLLIRPPQAGDGAAVTEARRESQEQINKWLLWSKDVTTPGDDEARARDGAARFILREDIRLAGVEKATGRLVLWTGLHQPDWDRRHFTIGYWVRKSAQGQGYAAESTNALVRYAFNALAARRIEITHAAGNIPSQRTIEKLGFIKEGVQVKELLLPDGTYADRLIYARLSDKGLPKLDVKWGPP